VEWQLNLKQKMSGMFQLEEQNPGAFFSLMGLAMIYGMVHAAGPGHRKTIIFSLFLGRKSKWWEPLTAGFFSAGLHGLSGMVLILMLHGLSRGMLSLRINRLSLYFEGITYLVLLLLALFLLIYRIIHFKKPHEHVSEKKNPKGLYSTLTAASLFPCPGAVMILMFSLAVGKLGLGIWAIIFLSVGMGITVSFTAYLAMTSRQGLFLALKKRENLVESLSGLMELAAYGFLIVYSAWAVMPFLCSI
jgi:nickel/cobalt exporter